MICCRFTAQFDHGIVTNSKEDVKALVGNNESTDDGKIVRGLGTSYLSPEAAERDKRLSKERGRIDREFARKFVRSPIPGLYVLPDAEAGKKFLEELKPDPEINARCVTYNLDSVEKNSAEMEEWIEKVKAQFTTAPLGRDPSMMWADAETGMAGLKVIESLKDCPVLSSETREAIDSLVYQARNYKITREEFKRQIALVPYTMDSSVGGETVKAPAKAEVFYNNPPKEEKPTGAFAKAALGMEVFKIGVDEAKPVEEKKMKFKVGDKVYCSNKSMGVLTILEKPCLIGDSSGRKTWWLSRDGVHNYVWDYDDRLTLVEEAKPVVEEASEETPVVVVPSPRRGPSIVM